MGTAFAATEEDDEIPDSQKELIVGSDGDNTIYTHVFNIINTAATGGAPWPEGLAARAFSNRFSREWHGRETELRERMEEVLPAYREAQQRGDIEEGPTYFGESSSFINKVRTAAEVVHTVCDEAEQQLRRRAAELVK
jgi:nitronate monooxygenase